MLGQAISPKTTMLLTTTKSFIEPKPSSWRNHSEKLLSSPKSLSQGADVDDFSDAFADVELFGRFFELGSAKLERFADFRFFIVTT